MQNGEYDISYLGGEHVTQHIIRCPDGVYCWYYEFPMLKNPTILFTVWKVLGISFGAVWLLVFLLTLVGDSGSPWLGENLMQVTLVFLALMAVFLVISILAYLLVAASFGGYYVVLFEMDEQRIVHTQVPRQFKRAEAIAWLTMFAGLAAGNVGRVGQGLLVATKSSSSSILQSVTSLKPRRGRQTIYVDQGLSKNQVYASGEDFDFVLSFLQLYCPNAVMK